MVIFHINGSCQIFSLLVFDQIEQYLVENRGFTPGLPLHIIAHSSYIAALWFVPMCILFFGDFLGLFGGLVFTSTSFYMHCVMWLVTQKPKAFSFHRLTLWSVLLLVFYL
ncbi:putative amino acid transporter, transmembrane domain-containing protein [Rosa chinensis]|uniref:Putative amino acid transporter, transmembrane domain-containing protein n=1 Tax=Rosa chinensis TaxID=74649 RepID=A0A2P6QVJ4_ROSCH|nr:putative amino acid transporter, transmembrane domain-containing protein [Rosa chinensis]